MIKTTYLKLLALLILIVALGGCNSNHEQTPSLQTQPGAGSGTQADIRSGENDCAVSNSIAQFPSPDDAYVAFVVAEDTLTSSHTLCMAHSDGTGVSYLLQAPHIPKVSWSPDSEKFAVATVAGGASALQSQIAVVDAATASVDYRLPVRGSTGCFGSEVLAKTPAWSPDGDALAFVGRATRDEGCGQQVFVTHDGVEEIAIHSKSYMDIVNLQWSTDGEKVTATTWSHEEGQVEHSFSVY